MLWTYCTSCPDHQPRREKSLNTNPVPKGNKTQFLRPKKPTTTVPITFIGNLIWEMGHL